MKTKILAAAMLLVASAASADVVMTVNGTQVEKTAARLTFDGDNVTVAYTDNSVSIHDLGDVAFSFTRSTGISPAMAFGTISVEVGNTLEVGGIAAGCTLQVYDVRGRLAAQAVARGATCSMDIAALEPGVYILRAGKEIVKFVKR